MGGIRGSRIGVSAAAALMVALAMSFPGVASAVEWNSTAPPVTGASQSELLGIDCLSSEACTAVGKDGVSGGPGGAFGDIWSKGKEKLEWTFASGVVRNPPGSSKFKNGVLRGVSCSSAEVCVAVGSYGREGTPNLMAETRVGSTWTLWTPLVGTNAEFNDVSCVELSGKPWCMAVGYRVSKADDKPFAMTFDGSTWVESAVVSKPDATLKGISCLSKAFCMAVGETTPPGEGGRLLDEIWEEVKSGEWKWTDGEPPILGSGSAPILNAVDCLVEKEGEKGTFCMAAGTVQKSPGGWKPIAPTWRKTTSEVKWFSGSEPKAGSEGEEIKPSGVSCLASNECWTVGEANVGSTKKLWADKWNLAEWEAASMIATPTGATGAQLHDIACYAAFNCKAVGWTLSGSTPTALVETLTP